MTAQPVSAHVVSRVDGELIESYLPLDNGECELIWMFDGAGEPVSIPRKYLVVRLTEDEARSVFERDRTKTGILEPVRHQMTHRRARIVQNPFEGGDLRGYTSITIPADGDEASFLRVIDNTPVETLRMLRQDLKKHLAEVRALEAEVKERGLEINPLLTPVRFIEHWFLQRRVRKLSTRIQQRVENINDVRGDFLAADDTVLLPRWAAA